jgi:hypothetical protein
LFVHQKKNPQKPLAKVKRTREEMQTTLKNRKKVAVESPKIVLKRKNRVEEGGTLGSRIKREQEIAKAIIKSDEGQSGTIYSANIGITSVKNGIGSHIDYIGTIDDISM